MHASLIRRRPAAIIASTLAAVGVCAAVAIAAPLMSAGGAQLRMENRSETVATSTNSVAWINLSGPAGHVVVPVAAGTTRLINARFTGESNCNGPNSGYCRVRIIAFNTVTAAITELSPSDGLDFAFDSDAGGVASDLSEGNAIERSYRLPAGNWSIRVQYSVSNNTVQFILDDWHLAVESSQ